MRMTEVIRRAILLKFFAAEVNSSYFDKYLIVNVESLHEDRCQDQVIVTEIGSCCSNSK